MIQLEKICGLPLALDHNRLVFQQPLREVMPIARTFEEMKAVLKDATIPPENMNMYLMYRDVHFDEHKHIIAQSGVQYDITVIPPGTVGPEYYKTAGHYHALKPGTHFAYPEVYEIISGRALFLLQKMDENFEKLITVVAIEGRAGDKIVYPPNYGHIIVNIDDDTLVTGNWVAQSFERMYKQVSDRQGMAYYVLKAGHGYKFEKNFNYDHHPEVRIITNKYMNQLQITGKGSLYYLGVSNPQALEFLTHPEKYAVELSSITS